MMETVHRIDADSLHIMVARILSGLGSSDDEAQIVAGHLVGSNLRGHDSHGVGMLSAYVRSIRAGALLLNHQPVRVIDAGVMAVYDGGHGFGHSAARQVTAEAIELAGRHGVAVVGLKMSGHVGRIGTYGEQVAAAGLVGVFFVNAVGRPPIVAPFGAAEARWSTNPFCIALPQAVGQHPLILDFATSAIAIGKARVARDRGELVADDVLLDDHGKPTTDPRYALEAPLGSLTAFGAHKGSGLGLICDLICGAVLGGGTAQPQNPIGSMMINNMVAIVIDPARLGAPDAIQHEIQAMIDYVRSARPRDPATPVRVPGEIEAEMMRERTSSGIPIEEKVWRTLEALERECCDVP